MHALSRISAYMSLSKKLSLLNALFVSQFNYCPLAWMCHSRTLSNRMNKLHEKCLRVIYYNKKSTFPKLLDKGYICFNTQSTFGSIRKRNV